MSAGISRFKRLGAFLGESLLFLITSLSTVTVFSIF
jgi:hypothetical protein